MKKIIIAILVGASANIFAQKLQEMEPQKVKFNAVEAKEILALGKSTIKGIAIAREYTNANVTKNPLNKLLGMDVTGTKHLAPPGTVVMLFPVTDYFKEYYKMRERYKHSRKYKAVMSKEAFSYRLETKVGENGAFTFEQMKPGKYYIETYFGYVGTGVGYNQVGRTDYYNGFGGHMGSSPIYQGYFYDYYDNKVESKFVEIKKDGEMKEIRL